MSPNVRLTFNNLNSRISHELSLENNDNEIISENNEIETISENYEDYDTTFI